MTTRLAFIFLPSLFAAMLQGASIQERLYLDTSGLSSTGGDYTLDFLLQGASGNTALISNLQFQGGGSPDSGDLSSLTLAVYLGNFGSEGTWLFSPGRSLSFNLISSDHPPLYGLTGDVLDIFIEDASGNPLSTNDPSGNDALLMLTLTGGQDRPELFADTVPALQGIRLTTTPPLVSSAPEPKSARVGLLGLMLLGLVARIRVF